MITIWVPGVPVGVPRPRARHVESRKGFDSQVTLVRSLIAANTPQTALQALDDLSAPEGFTHIYTPESGAFKSWRKTVYLLASLGLNRPSAPIEGPVRLNLVFMMPRPACYSRKKDPEGPIWAPSNPNDWDNLGKVTDVFTKLNYWHDDRQACDARVRKCFHAKDGTPGALFMVAAIDGVPNDLPREIPGMGDRGGPVGYLPGLEPVDPPAPLGGEEPVEEDDFFDEDDV